MISAQRIEWQGLDSLNFDLITDLAFDSDDGNSPSFLNQDGIYTEHYDGHRTVYRAKKNEFFNPTFTFIKAGFGDFTIDEQRKILNWLSTEKPGWLNVYHDDSNVLSYRCFGTWESIELYKLGNGRVVGYVVTFASTHPYAWSNKFIYPEVHHTIAEIGNNDETNDYLDVDGLSSVAITCNTDEYNKLIYPKVVVDFRGKNIYYPVGERPKDAERMIPNALYRFVENGKDAYCVRVVVNNEINIVDVISINGGAEPSQELLEANPNGYFHIQDGKDHTIKRIVDGRWEIVAKISAAVKINTTYTFNGEDISKEVILKGASLDEKITLDGTNKIVTVDSNLSDYKPRIIGDDFNWEWLPLAYGDNKITISGNCAVQIQWIEPRKVGSL